MKIFTSPEVMAAGLGCRGVCFGSIDNAVKAPGNTAKQGTDKWLK
ncbi:MAG: hypothetical protein QGF67_05050 [Lentisphaeria bacterium]|nr:hypothetical protein [Lentisphaeria bacterium]MDP7740784.1 hypothetical protein [Lentisphaeria bacterium]